MAKVSESDMKTTVKDNWKEQVDEEGNKVWVNKKRFYASGNLLVQVGVVRSLEDAHALEVQRDG